QAEDGIRDDLVTGVQTCALPICATCWLTGTLFQLTSAAFTVTANGAPADCVEMLTDVLPVAEPGSAVSPGTRTCSFTALLTPTEIGRASCRERVWYGRVAGWVGG